MDCRYWKMTHLISTPGKQPFRLPSGTVEGTRGQANRHLHRIYQKFYPSAKVRLVRAVPDRVAEAKARRTMQ